MPSLRRATRAAAIIGAAMLAGGMANAQAPVDYVYCGRADAPTLVPAGRAEFLPREDGCGTTLVNGSVASVFGAPGSPFLAAIDQRIVRLDGGGTPALAYGPTPGATDTGAFAGLDRMLATKAPPPGNAAAPTLDPNLIWVRGAGSYGTYDGFAGEPGANLTTGAIFTGIDLPLAEGLVAGLSGGWSSSSFELDDNAGALDADAWHAGLYAIGASGNWRTKAIVTYEYYDLSSRRDVLFDTATARASYNADHVEALAEISHVSALGETATIEPYVAGGLSWIRVDAFSETGGGPADLSAGAQDETWPYALVGLRLVGTVPVGSAVVSPSLDLAWRHVFGDVDPQAIYEIGGEALPVVGYPIARDTLVVQAGFDAAFTSGWRTSLRYKGDLATEAQQHMLTGGVAVPF